MDRSHQRSGVAYPLLLPGLAMLAAPAPVLLLVFITGVGVTLAGPAGARGGTATSTRRGRPRR